MHVYNLEEFTEIYFYRAGGVQQTKSLIEEDLFQNDVTDIRKTELWKQIKETSSTRFVLMKYKQGDAIVASTNSSYTFI